MPACAISNIFTENKRKQSCLVRTFVDLWIFFVFLDLSFIKQIRYGFYDCSTILFSRVPRLSCSLSVWQRGALLLYSRLCTMRHWRIREKLHATLISALVNINENQRINAIITRKQRPKRNLFSFYIFFDFFVVELETCYLNVLVSECSKHRYI